MNAYKLLKEFVNHANVRDNMSVRISVDLLNSISFMVEDLRESVEHTQKLRPNGFNGIQSGVDSYLTTKAIDHANFVSRKYWAVETEQ